MRATAVLLALACGGCSAMLRVSAGPTVDSMGHVGGEVRITCGIGPGPVVAPLALHAGGQRTATGDRSVIGGGGAIELAGCSDAHWCGAVGLGFIGRDLLGATDRHIDGFGLSGRIAAHFTPYQKHSGPGWLLHLTTDQVIGVGGEIDLTGYVVAPMRGGVFFFGASAVIGTFVQ